MFRLLHGSIQARTDHASIDGVGNRKAKGDQTLNEALSQAVTLGSAKAAARLQEETTTPVRTTQPSERDRDGRGVCCKREAAGQLRMSASRGLLKYGTWVRLIIKGWCEDEVAGVTKFPGITLDVIGQGINNSLMFDGWIKEKNTSAVTARPDTVSGQTERKPSKA